MSTGGMDGSRGRRTWVQRAGGKHIETPSGSSRISFQGRLGRAIQVFRCLRRGPPARSCLTLRRATSGHKTVATAVTTDVNGRLQKSRAIASHCRSDPAQRSCC
eukprot:SAG31_NODE_333_length_17527_cov_6.972056_16_plen_104_part_00